ncbi:MAG TPA: methionyl-tRNA formyltransferase [Thermoleophilia bacterium]|nr:methionyl-tRNA formyltransferase [Thermoleophilia bacterium]
MRVAWAGTARFAALVLERVLAAGRHEVAVCVSTPDRPRGRHGTPQPSALKVAALERGLRLLQPDDLRSPAVLDELLSYRLDVFVACAYGVIVPESVFTALPSLVVHPSPVPRWRGAAPVVRALMAGETRLGVATLRMAAGVDEGPVADERVVDVPSDCDAGQAYELLAEPAAESLLATLDAMADGSLAWRPQVGEASYAEKLSEEDRVIDWRRPARVIADQVRALAPDIGAHTELLGRRLLVWRAAALPALPDGSHRNDRLVLPTGEGYLEILELQEAGRRRISAQEYLRGAGRRLTQA